jgi:hypothetical protein
VKTWFQAFAFECNSFRYVEKYRRVQPCFNDDIQVGLALSTTLLLCVKTHSIDDSQQVHPCKQSDTRE